MAATGPDNVGEQVLEPRLVVAWRRGKGELPRGGGPVAQAYRPGEGDLLVMGGRCQAEREHTVPKATVVVSPVSPAPGAYCGRSYVTAGEPARRAGVVEGGTGVSNPLHGATGEARAVVVHG